MSLNNASEREFVQLGWAWVRVKDIVGARLTGEGATRAYEVHLGGASTPLVVSGDKGIAEVEEFFTRHTEQP